MGNVEKIKFGSRAKYQIVVSGKLDRSWSDTLAGMEILTEEVSENQFNTSLTGIIKDQAELSGILNTIYEMHLPVISVECLKMKL